MPIISAGLLMYKFTNKKSRVLLVHPGGPFWKNKDEGSWSIPKGQADAGETDVLEVAKREFEEETGFAPLGDFKYLTSVKRKDGKIIEVWMFEGDLDPAKIKSNIIEIDWPPKSGKKMQIPEIDRGSWFGLDEARKKVNSYQIGIIDAFEKSLK